MPVDRIEDVEVRMAAPQDGEPQAASDRIRLFLDDFESYRGKEELLRQGGWVDLLRSADKGKNGAGVEKAAGPLARLLGEYWAPRSGKAERGDFAVDGGDSMSGAQSLLMEKLENAKTVTAKIFSLPLRAPFGVSERAFAIVDRDADAGHSRRQDPGTLRRRGDVDRASRDAASSQNPGIKVAGPSGEGGGETRLLSVSPAGTYYYYSFDGRLIAEYNGLGICVRDYIYMGGKLVAEYRPQESSYFYYATDQIGSTRIVTNDTGAVVYAAAHDPYGGIQRTWTSAYDPALKFSGKERDTESGLDYFGARYYDHSLYRFLSVDPVIPVSLALSNPQRWNLYDYCGNNPINYVDPDGRATKYVHFGITYVSAIKAGLPHELALTIAQANQAVDENMKTHWLNPLATVLHFPTPPVLSRAYEIAFTCLDPKKLGLALHVIQDSFFHAGYSLWSLGHFIPSGISWAFSGLNDLFDWDLPVNIFDVDNAFADLDRLSAVVGITDIILSEYRSRLFSIIVRSVSSVLSVISPVI